MTETHRDATLLIFTLGCEEESRRRSLLPERWRGVEVELRGACLDTAVAAGREAGCRVEVSCPQPLALADGVGYRPQGGGAFGARLDRAFSECLARHGGPVVVVGTDVPGLAAAHVRQALDRLAEDPDRVVVGPSPDGGFYLLAAARPIEGLASMVSWCCRSTLATLRRALARAGRAVELLDPLADLDNPADLEHWIARDAGAVKHWRTLLASLRRLLAARRRPLLDPRAPAMLAGWLPAVTARGPPAPSCA